MIFRDVIRALQLEQYAEILRSGWPDGGEGRYPGTAPFLDETAIVASCRRLHYPDEYIERIGRARRAALENKAIQALLEHAHHCLFEEGTCPLDQFGRWPSIEALRKALPEDAGAFYLLAMLSGMPQVLQRFESACQSRGIPPAIIADTIGDMARDLPVYWRNRGGFPPKSLAFRLSVNLGGEYFCLGRLAFHLTRFAGRMRLFRHKNTGRILVFAEDGVRFMQNGQLDGPGRKHKSGGNWTAYFRATDGQISGFVMAPDGGACRKPLSLPADEYQPVLAAGDCVLDIHIPSGSPMSFEACGESMRMALEFFPRHFPERAFKAFCCESWLFDPQLLELVPRQSNIARFLREFHLFPAISDDDHLRVCIFGMSARDARAPLPAETSLQRAALGKIQAGVALNSSGGGGVILREDLNWGAGTS